MTVLIRMYRMLTDLTISIHSTPYVRFQFFIISSLRLCSLSSRAEMTMNAFYVFLK